MRSAVLLLILAGCSAVPDLSPHPMGIALHPLSVDVERARSLQWSSNWVQHQVQYALSETAETEIQTRYEAWAASSKPGCDATLQCTYEAAQRGSHDALQDLTRRFREHIAIRHLDVREAATLVVDFVQSIPYARVDDLARGLLPPALVAYRKKGDCDSTALLAVSLLTELGIESHVFVSNDATHAVVGIAIPAPGDFAVVDGRRYAMVDTTMRVPIGRAPTFSRYTDWKRVAVRPDRAVGPDEIILQTIHIQGDADKTETLHLDFDVPDGWPTRHTVDVVFDPRDLAKAEARARDFARDTGHAKSADGSWTWYPPEGCRTHGIPCIFQRFDRDNKDFVGRFVRELAALDGDHDASRLHLAQVLTSIVADRAGSDDDATPFMTPPATALTSSGDHRSLVVLQYLLFAEAGFDTIFIEFGEPRRGFPAVGVNVKAPAGVQTLEHDGNSYVIVMPTRPFGELLPRYYDLDKWHVIPYER